MMENRNIILSLCTSWALLAPLALHAELTFNHKLDAPMGTVTVNGHTLQAVHSQTNIIYANAGDKITNNLPDFKTYMAYVRWYNFDTDSAATNIINDNSKNVTFVTNDRGWFLYRTANNNNEAKTVYTMQDTVYRLAVDQSNYTNWINKFTTNDMGEGDEPVLGKRLIFEYRPASEMAARVDTCTGESFLETHDLIAPTNRQLYIGPDYQFINVDVKTPSGTTYKTRTNYYYNAASPTAMNVQTNWRWYIDGAEAELKTDKAGTNYISAGRFIGAMSTEAGKHTYELKYGFLEDKVDTIDFKQAKYKKFRYINKVNGVDKYVNDNKAQAAYFIPIDGTLLKAGDTVEIKANSSWAAEVAFLNDTSDLSVGAEVKACEGFEFSKKPDKTKSKEYIIPDDCVCIYVIGKTEKEGGWDGSPESIVKISKVGTEYNIAQFHVTYMDKSSVGPDTISPSTANMEKIYEQTFNFDTGLENKLTFWGGHLSVDESTYGYFYRDYANVSGGTSCRVQSPTDVYWSEYTFANYHKSWGSGGGGIWNHNDTIADAATYNGVKNYTGTLGYLLYCDGSEQPGQVFDLDVAADLCPGSKMFFSAWMADLSGTNDGACGPNMDFVVMGIDDEGKEHSITTFTTGEWGGNAKSTSGLTWKTWYQVFFPVEFKGDIEYSTYRLKIMNKGRSAQGNDFALDDIRIYVRKPPVYPIQASTYDCPTGAYDSITAYLRVDYQAIDRTNTHFYYQWRDQENNVIDTVYYNDVSHTYGVIEIPATEGEIPAADTCASLLSFDTKYYATSDPVVKYIKESVGDTMRYIMYIAQPLVVRTNYTYTGFVAIRPEDLNGARDGCGTFADLLIAGSTRITINGEAKGDSVVDICGNRSYTLDIELTYIAKNTATGELQLYTTPCRADWLVGDTAWVKEHPDVYGGKTFAEIEAAIMAYRENKNDPVAKPIIDKLVHDQLLHLDTATTLMQPSIALSYTAFPVPGSAANNMSVCLTPHFLHIYPSTEIKNMMMVGSSSDVLPEEIKTSPRRVRISNAQKATGEFYLPVYPYGEGVTYVVDTVMLINSTAPSWDTIYLASEPVKHKNDSIIAADSIKISGDLSSLEAGYDYTFHVVFEDEDTGCSRGYTYFTLRIVPDTVTWLGGEWNKDDNWSSFMPLEQTNVILQPKDYNVTFTTAVSDSIYDVNYVRNECNNIYFPDSASLAGQELLSINGQAFIDVKEFPYKWTLTAFPFQGMVSGDLFVSQSESTEPFTVAPINQTVGNFAHDRYDFEVYNSEYDAASMTWKIATGDLARDIQPGEAVMIGIDCDNDDVNPIIRLPKQDTYYRYYDKTSHLWLDMGETVSRSVNYGKPAYTGDTDVTLKEMYTDAYLFGNPTFGYIDITDLVNNNSSKLTGRYYMNTAGDDKRPRTVNFDGTPNAKNADPHILLPPFRGCILEGKGVESDQLTISVATAVVNKSGRVPRRGGSHTTTDYSTHTDGSGVATGIEDVYQEEDAIVAIYDLAGRLIGNAVDQLTNGLYIIKTGSAVRKVLIRK